MIVDGVDDGDVVVWVAGEENDGVRGGEFAGKGCAGLQELRLALMAEEGEWRGWRWRTYAWADAGNDGDGFGHGVQAGDNGKETGSGVHKPEIEGRGVDI